jgi:hypothetical protein
MYYIIKKTFSTIKDRVHQLKNTDYFNVPDNILALTDRKLLSI